MRCAEADTGSQSRQWWSSWLTETLASVVEFIFR